MFFTGVALGVADEVSRLGRSPVLRGNTRSPGRASLLFPASNPVWSPSELQPPAPCDHGTVGQITSERSV